MTGILRTFSTTGGAVALVVTLGCSPSEVALDERSTEPFDMVISNGRVIDPETALDAIRHLGIRDGTIEAVSETPLDDRVAVGGELIDASGLVVAPGFIDLHAHGQSAIANTYQAHDGVTTALELEWGYLGIAEWLETRRGKAPIHYGASVNEGVARALAMLEGPDRDDLERRIREAMMTDEAAIDELMPIIAQTFYQQLSEEDYAALRAELEQGLLEGGIGIGLAHQYTPGAGHGEVFEVFRIAAEQEMPIFTHVRSMGFEAMQEVVANALGTGASLHIVHVNSMSLGELPQVLELIAGARERGVDITTEAYPYTAASTFIGSAIFDEGGRSGSASPTKTCSGWKPVSGSPKSPSSATASRTAW